MVRIYDNERDIEGGAMYLNPRRYAEGGAMYLKHRRCAEGGAMYLSPRSFGGAMYLNPRSVDGGFINFSAIGSTLGNAASKVADFVRTNKDVIQTGVDAVAKIGNTIVSVKNAIDAGNRENALIEYARKKREKKNAEISETNKETIKQMIESAIAAKGGGLKRF